MNRISNEYYIIIIFIGPRARTTIHTTSPGRNNSKQDLIKIITILFIFGKKKPRFNSAATNKIHNLQLLTTLP